MKQTQNKQETTAHKNKNKTSVQNLGGDSETNESEWTGKAENRDHFALHPQKRGGLLGTGTGGRGGGAKERRLDRGYGPKKTGETVDRRQN